MLVIEAHVNARDYAGAAQAYTQFLAFDKTIFRGDEATVNALRAAAKTGMGDLAPKSEAERHIRVFIEAKGLQPESYISAARLIRKAGDPLSAQKILEAGRRVHPWNNQIRADLAIARILTGRTEAYGTRPALDEELMAIAKGRRVNPKLWETVAFWLKTEAKLPLEKLRPLRELADAYSRPDLAGDAVRD